MKLEFSTESKPDSFAAAWGRFRPKTRRFKSPFAIIPLIDVALLLFIFFAAGSRFVLQPGILVELPSGRFAAGTPYGPMIVTLTQEGFVFFNDDRVRLDDLAHAFSEAVRRNKEIPLLIEADYRVPYGAIAKVMALADSAGIRQVNLAVTESVREDAGRPKD